MGDNTDIVSTETMVLVHEQSSEQSGSMVSVIDSKTDKKLLALERAGATREAAYRTMVEALNAEVMTIDKFGDEHTAPDHGARIRAAEMISKLHGDMKEVVVDNRTYNTVIQASAEEVGMFMKMLGGVKEQLEKLRVSGRQTGEVVDAEVVE